MLAELAVATLGRARTARRKLSAANTRLKRKNATPIRGVSEVPTNTPMMTKSVAWSINRTWARLSGVLV
jgi:hypothetical protein